MHSHRGRCTMINKKPRSQRLKRKNRTMTRSRQRRGCPSTRTDHSVKVNVMRHLIARMVVEVKLNQIPFANTNKFSRNMAAKCPIGVFHSVSELSLDLFDLKMDDHFRRVRTGDWRGNMRGVRKNSLFFSDYFFITIFITVLT